MTKHQERILALADLVREADGWTTYSAIGEVVYAPGNSGQTVGTTMRRYGKVTSAHRVLEVGGGVAKDWVGVGGGREECIARLREEGIWDASRDGARLDREIDAAGLRRLEAKVAR